MNLKIALCVIPLLVVSPYVLSGQEQESGVFSERAKQVVVLENGTPATKFVSRTGSVAFVYFRKHGEEDGFAVYVIDWDTFKMRTGWLYLTRTRVAFESDDDKKRSFDAARSEVTKTKGQKTYNGMNFLLIKVSGKEKKFMVSFVPVPASRTGAWGAHQKPVFDYIEQIVTNYDETLVEFQQRAARLVQKPEQEESDRAGSASSTQPKVQEVRVIVDISSEPSGAEIYVDGVFTSSTPSKLSLQVGVHTITISRPGFKDWERQITVEAGSAKTVNAILEKAKLNDQRTGFRFSRRLVNTERQTAGLKRVYQHSITRPFFGASRQLRQHWALSLYDALHFQAKESGLL